MLAALALVAAVSAAPAAPDRQARRLARRGRFPRQRPRVEGGAVLLRKGYGMADRENGVVYDADTVFDVGSITKQFTAAAILKLEMQGKLHVEDTIGKYFASAPEDKRGITLHQLLTHTAGLESDFAGDYDPVSRDEYVKRILAVEASQQTRRGRSSTRTPATACSGRSSRSRRACPTRSTCARTCSSPPG